MDHITQIVQLFRKSGYVPTFGTLASPPVLHFFKVARYEKCHFCQKYKIYIFWAEIDALFNEETLFHQRISRKSKSTLKYIHVFLGVNLHCD